MQILVHPLLYRINSIHSSHSNLAHRLSLRRNPDLIRLALVLICHNCSSLSWDSKVSHSRICLCLQLQLSQILINLHRCHRSRGIHHNHMDRHPHSRTISWCQLPRLLRCHLQSSLLLKLGSVSVDKIHIFRGLQCFRQKVFVPYFYPGTLLLINCCQL